MTLNCSSFFTLSNSIMSRDVLLSLLRQGSNGSEILQILDSIADGVPGSVGPDSAAGPTLNPIQF